MNSIFNQLKKEKEAKKNQKTTETAEVQISLTIQQHDMETKATTVKRLIDRGNQVLIIGAVGYAPQIPRQVLSRL